MSTRVWGLSLLAALLIFAAFGLGFTTGSRGAPLRQQHSQPAASIPQQMVAVAVGGNTFHDPRCTYIHGKAELMPADEAIRRGYNPCVRCMRKALAK